MLVADGGNMVKKLNLFRGAIMESGAPSGYVVFLIAIQLAPLTNSLYILSASGVCATSRDGVPPVSELESGYQEFATLAGCGGALHNGTSLQCLRSQPALTLYKAMVVQLENSTEAFPYNRVRDDYWFPVLPSAAVRAGKVALVPIITGTLITLAFAFPAVVLRKDTTAPCILILLSSFRKQFG
jgi:hypothetical protein